MARYFDVTLKNSKGGSISYWADYFSINRDGILSVYSRDCGDIKVKIQQDEDLSVETIDVKEEWEEMIEYYEQAEAEGRVKHEP